MHFIYYNNASFDDNCRSYKDQWSKVSFRVRLVQLGVREMNQERERERIIPKFSIYLVQHHNGFRVLVGR